MIVYADNAATTAVSKKSMEAMLPYFDKYYGNPSSVHQIGREAAKTLIEARKFIAQTLGADEKEIYFTSGGTEADNWAITFAANMGAKKGKKHLITTKIEHHAVLYMFEKLEKEGFEVTYLDVYKDGIVKIEDVLNAIREDTAFVSVMYANNEIGTIQPIAEIGKLCREKGVLFHTDAVQAVGHLPINVKDENIDMLSLSAHKFHGPKGVGALYCRKGIKLESFLLGGGQEMGKRASTENVAGIVGMAAALNQSAAEMTENEKIVKAMRDRLIEELTKVPHSILNGHRIKRLPGNVNFCFEGIEGESMLLLLDMKGICASSGSACTSGSLDPSHVLLALGLPHATAHGSLRLTLSEYNSENEIDYIIEELPKIIQRLREMSPVWESIIKEEE